VLALRPGSASIAAMPSQFRGVPGHAGCSGATNMREDELFLGARGRIFVTHHRATPSSEPPRHAIIVPPLFEELSRTRKVLVNVARDLAADGCDVVRFDYPGTGLSDGHTDELTLANAAEALRDVIAYIRQRGAGTIQLLGFRFGGYLALRAAAELATVRLVLWEPVLDLAAQFRELLAVEVSNQLVTFGKVRRTRDQIVTALRAGESALLDGNRVSSELYREIEAAPAFGSSELAALGGRLLLVLWENRELERAAHRLGIPCALVDDVKFSWRHIRTLEPRSAHLFETTLASTRGG
jgi:alpha/beta superfamily hydrolase